MAVAESSFVLESVIRGHHASKQHWTPVVGESLAVECEPSNPFDSYAVSVSRDGTIVGHVPREVRRQFYTFLHNGGNITCEVTGHRKYGKGLEVPCVYEFRGSRETVRKVKKTLGKSKSKCNSCIL